MQAATKWKRPCSQCASGFRGDKARGQQTDYITESRCCGAWVVSFAGAKPVARRPYRSEYLWAGNA